MFLHHTMADREVLRSCEGCESPHLRLVADRLRQKVDDMRRIRLLCAEGQRHGTEFSAITEIEAIAKEGLDHG